MGASVFGKKNIFAALAQLFKTHTLRYNHTQTSSRSVYQSTIHTLDNTDTTKNCTTLH